MNGVVLGHSILLSALVIGIDNRSDFVLRAVPFEPGVEVLGGHVGAALGDRLGQVAPLIFKLGLQFRLFLGAF